MKFSDELKNIQEELICNQNELSTLLYDIPPRTLQSWLLGEKEPPKYVQELVIYKLETRPNKKIQRTE
ncbi:MAG: hypothetical protein KAT04_06010 [Methylococcales bacterium]|nr:hypothetical protein [Methylococcales bacterium]